MVIFHHGDAVKDKGEEVRGASLRRFLEKIPREARA